MKPRTRATEEEIQQMIQMRRDGYSTVEIGRKFGKDHTTITHHCQNAGITKNIKKIFKKVEPFELEQLAELVDEEPVNKGKTYAEYLEEEKNRKWKKRKDIALVGSTT